MLLTLGLLLVCVRFAAAEEQGTLTRRITLANGMRIVLVRDAVAPVVTVQLNILAGADESPSEFGGLAHAQEHMAFRGCVDMTAAQRAAIYTQLGGENNAETGQSVTKFYVTVPAPDLALALEAQARCVWGIEDAEPEWQHERKAVEREVEGDLGDAERAVVVLMNESMFAGTPYANDGLGNVSSLERTTASMLKQFQEQWYVPSNMVLVVAGDIDLAHTADLVRESFETIPGRDAPARAPVVLPAFRSRRYTLRGRVPSTVTYLGFRMPGTDSEDYAAAVILAEVLVSERAKLRQLVASGSVQDADFTLEETYRKASLGIASVVTSPGARGSTGIRAFRHIFGQYASHGVPPSLVDAARCHVISEARMQINSVPSLADTWSDAVAVEGRSSPDEDIEALRTATYADVNRVARRYLGGSHTITVVLRPEGTASAASLKNPGRAERIEPPARDEVELPDWARRRLSPLYVPPPAGDVADMHLSNGLHLIVKPSAATSTVTLTGSVRHEAGLQTARGLEGVSEILDGLFAYGSLSKGRRALQTSLDEICATESAGYRFSLTADKAQFARGVDLLADNELHPALTRKNFMLLRRDKEEELDDQPENPTYLSDRAMATALLPVHDPALREPTWASLHALSLAKVKAYQTLTFRPDLTTIVIVGDISPEEARRLVEQFFGAWDADGPPPRTTLPAVPRNRAASRNIVDWTLSEDRVVLSQQIELDRSAPGYYAFRLGAEVLGGEYAGRLFRDLRETTGYVYSVDAGIDAIGSRATFSIRYSCRPRDLAWTREIIDRDLKEMREIPVSDRELDRVKGLLLRQLVLQELSQDAIASGMLERVEDGLSANERSEASKIYMTLTGEDVKKAFAAAVDLNDFAEVVVGPATGFAFAAAAVDSRGASKSGGPTGRFGSRHSALSGSLDWPQAMR